MKPLTAIALSGGIDSLVAAYLLKEQGHDLIGIHFITGFECVSYESSSSHQPVESGSMPFSSFRSIMARKMSTISEQLDIPVEIIDCRSCFKTHVINYFVRTYRNGKTPNPCLICNPVIKFGFVLDAARQFGASQLATGHYARALKDPNGRHRLLKGADRVKDQSYFLALMTRKHLDTALFPLGEFTKTRVVALARDKGLVPVEKAESQDICFIKRSSYGDFLASQPDFKPVPGPVVDMAGKQIGMHQGLHLFTVGQRKGINCPASAPYYVIRLDSCNNRLVVGFKDDLTASGCYVEQINWIGKVPETAFRAYTRVRYRHAAAASTVFPTGEHSAVIRFDEPQQAVTPGQGAVFYQNEDVLGGGWITGDLRETS